MKNENKKAVESLSEQDREALELLQKAHEKRGMQLRIDGATGDLNEIDELRAMLGRQAEDPEEKYNIYYKGISNVLKKYLPSGKEFEEGRRLIYDEKNIFLNRGKKKSDNNGIRKSDGRMTYQPIMGEILDIVAQWVAESRNPIDLYQTLYDLNEKFGYGHEAYDSTSAKVQAELNKGKSNESATGDE